MSADLKESPVPLAEISQGPNAFEAFLDRNQKGIIVFAILLALGAVVAVIYRGVERSRQETAGAALTKAADLAALQAVVGWPCRHGRRRQRHGSARRQPVDGRKKG